MLRTTVLIPAPEGGFTVLNPETSSTSQGESVGVAVVANLREATESYLEESPLRSTGQCLVATFQMAVNAWSSSRIRRASRSFRVRHATCTEAF